MVVLLFSQELLDSDLLCVPRVLSVINSKELHRRICSVSSLDTSHSLLSLLHDEVDADGCKKSGDDSQHQLVQPVQTTLFRRLRRIWLCSNEKFCFSFWSWWRWWKRGLCCRRNIVVFSVRFLSCWSHMFLIRIVKLRLHCCCCCCLRCCCCCYLLVSTSSTGVLVEAESNIRFVVTVGVCARILWQIVKVSIRKRTLNNCHQDWC